MTESPRASSGKQILVLVMLLIITDFSIFLDIPVLRQIMGFTFFTVVPGLLILYILKLNKLGLTEKIVLSVGLSVSFIMFFGLLINWVYPLLGYDRPLSSIPLLISFSVILLLFAIFAYLRNRRESFVNLSDLKLNTKEKLFILIPAFFPLLSILGMHLMNTTSNNTMVMTLLFLIAAYIVIVAIKHKQVPDRVYPPIIFLTSISLVLLFALRSSYLMGSDVHYASYIFQTTFDNQHWQIFEYSPMHACLSVTILPTIYQSFVNVDSDYLFKILYPLLFSFSPLVVFLISKKYIANLYAFLASVLYMSGEVFLTTAHSARSNVGILFFGLAIMVLFFDRLTDFNKKLLFTVFAASCITSHYSTAYIFFFILLLTWLGMQIIPRIVSRYQRKRAPPQNPLSGNPSSTGGRLSESKATSRSRLKVSVTIGATILFFVILFFWYSQVSESSFVFGVRFISHTLEKFQEFFILESRGGGVVSALGVGLGAKAIPHRIDFIFSWLTIAFIAIGVLAILVRYRHAVNLPREGETRPPGFLSQKIDAEFFILGLVCSGFLVAALALPFVFIGYGMGRTYAQLTIVLSPFFAIGGMVVARFLRFKWTYLVVLVVLIVYFLGTTGVTYQMFGDTRKITLNSEGEQYDALYIYDQEVYAAKWMGTYADLTPIGESRPIYSFRGGGELASQGKMSLYALDSSLLETTGGVESYIYLDYYNVTKHKAKDAHGIGHDLAQYAWHWAGKDKIYASNGAQIYGKIK